MLVVGGGPAGAAAASAAARSGARTVLLDAHPSPGGQIWRRPPAKGVAELPGMRAVAGLGRGELLAEGEGGPAAFAYGRLVLATGARERFLPFPGWTLPGVAGAGGLQLLAKGGWPVTGRTAVIGGTGPLLLAAASALRRGGARIAVVAEQAPPRVVRAFAASLAGHPAKLAQAAALRWSVGATPYRAGCWVRRALGADRLEAVEVTDGRRSWTLPCELLGCGYGLVPNTELAQHLGCATRNGAVAVDEQQATTAEGIYCAGGATGVGGRDTARLQGRIAGLAAAGRGDSGRALHGARDRAARFAEALEKAFALRPELRRLADPETVVCRCEDVRLRALEPHADWRSAKLHTRCGMGPCQGRVCGAAVGFLFGWEPAGVRPPVAVATVGTLAQARDDGAEGGQGR